MIYTVEIEILLMFVGDQASNVMGICIINIICDATGQGCVKHAGKV